MDEHDRNRREPPENVKGYGIAAFQLNCRGNARPCIHGSILHQSVVTASDEQKRTSPVLGDLKISTHSDFINLVGARSIWRFDLFGVATSANTVGAAGPVGAAFTVQGRPNCLIFRGQRVVRRRRDKARH
jgi:hypothetical protein